MKISVNEFLEAIKRGDRDTIRLQIEHEGFSANANMTLYRVGVIPDPYTRGYTPLHWAARYDQVEIVKYLLSRGAPINHQNAGGNTPLYLAIYHGSEAVANLLIQEGANVDIANTKVLGLSEYDCTALHYAVRWASVAVVRVILEKSTHSINVKDHTGKTPLQQTIERMLNASENGPLFTYEDKLTLIDVLLKCGADISLQEDVAGDTALHRAIQQISKDAPFIPKNGLDNIAIVKLLLNTTREESQEKLVHLLNITNNQDRTPLAQAVVCKQFMVSSLLHYAYGASLENEPDDVQAEVRDGFSFQKLRQIIEQGQLEVLVGYFERQDFEVNADMTSYTLGAPNFFTKGYRPLHWAVRYGQFNFVKFLVEKGALINQQNWGGNTPLHLAIYHGQLDIAAFLIQQGADVTIKNVKIALGWNNPEYGCTPLHYAVRRGNAEITRLILEKNSHFINLKDYTNKTPLQQSIERLPVISKEEPHLSLTYERKQALVAVLIQFGADVSTSYEETGDTPLHLAIKQIDDDARFHKENKEPEALVRLIIDEAQKQNANTWIQLFNIKNKEGLTPLGLAIALNNMPLALLLHMLYQTSLENEDDSVREEINRYSRSMGYIIYNKSKSFESVLSSSASNIVIMPKLELVQSLPDESVTLCRVIRVEPEQPSFVQSMITPAISSSAPPPPPPPVQQNGPKPLRIVRKPKSDLDSVPKRPVVSQDQMLDELYKRIRQRGEDMKGKGNSNANNKVESEEPPVNTSDNERSSRECNNRLI
ncbi:MAG: ankyrin repeat domain-containing protein [Gammaproteobacteria bacterium]|nr:ankyrin repeat domain-containing protein [Gammaproteobacteria bacterium]